MDFELGVPNEFRKMLKCFGIFLGFRKYVSTEILVGNLNIFKMQTIKRQNSWNFCCPTEKVYNPNQRNFENAKSVGI